MPSLSVTTNTPQLLKVKPLNSTVFEVSYLQDIQDLSLSYTQGSRIRFLEISNNNMPVTDNATNLHFNSVLNSRSRFEDCISNTEVNTLLR